MSRLPDDADHSSNADESEPWIHQPLLERADQPITPSALTSRRMHHRMINAYRAELAVVSEAELVEPEAGTTSARDHRRRGTYWLTMAAAIIAFAILVPRPEPQDESADDINLAVTTSFCDSQWPTDAVDEVERFRSIPGGERTLRALESLEVLAGLYRSLGNQLEDPLATTVATRGDELVALAASARRATLSADPTLDDQLRDLADLLAVAVTDLPETALCQVDGLRD